MMPQLTLENICCYETTDGPGDDEVYITVRGHKIWGPSDMGSDSRKTIDKTVKFEKHLEVEVWEADSWTSDDDFIGKFIVYENQSGKGEFESHLYGDGSHYLVNYKVH
jgi:hypothetical protein